MYFPSDASYQSDLDFLDGRTGPKERPLMAIHEDKATLLVWNDWPAGQGDLTLSLACVVEAPGPRKKKLQVFTGEAGGEPIATLDVICSDPYQILTVRLPGTTLPQSGPLSLRLQLEFGERLWLFAPDRTVTGGLEYHVPHLSLMNDAQADFLDRLCSLASLQTFSWKEGCVLDGIHAISQKSLHPGAEHSIRDHLDYFGFANGNLVYETPLSRRVANEFTTIETTLPFAQVARIDIQHPWIDMVLAFWNKLLRENGQIREAEMISSEGAYTVAYPMTVIARLRGEEQWIALAENLLIDTYQSLVQPEAIYLRHYADGRRTHGNWARGLAWLLLGHAQTLLSQEKPSERIVEQFQSLARFAATHQLENGLWACFVNEPTVLPDTSGSAGIAAAFSLGAKAGLLPAEYQAKASLSKISLLQNLTLEGFLDGCSQSNKGGEELQRSPYRVALPYAMGMLGLLMASEA
jgi:unsaturated rhamnogalacturonyl hydrolase